MFPLNLQTNCSGAVFSALTLLVGRQEGHLPCKNWVVGCWHGYVSGQGADLHMAHLMPLPLTVPCSSKSRLVLPSWFYLPGASVNGDAAAGVENRIRIGWNKFRQLVPLLTNKDILLKVKGKLYSSCVRSSMLHGSEAWPIRKENEVALQRVEMRMVRSICGLKLQDRIPSKGLRERLGLDDIISVLQQNRLWWYGHMLRKEQDNDWVKKCMEYEVDGARPRGRPKKTWREIVEKDCQTRGLNREDVVDHIKWMKQIRDDWRPR